MVGYLNVSDQLMDGKKWLWANVTLDPFYELSESR